MTTCKRLTRKSAPGSESRSSAVTRAASRFFITSNCQQRDTPNSRSRHLRLCRWLFFVFLWNFAYGKAVAIMAKNHMGKFVSHDAVDPGLGHSFKSRRQVNSAFPSQVRPDETTD